MIHALQFKDRSALCAGYPNLGTQALFLATTYFNLTKNEIKSSIELTDVH
jgi:hypothetical protein